MQPKAPPEACQLTRLICINEGTSNNKNKSVRGDKPRGDGIFLGQTACLIVSHTSKTAPQSERSAEFDWDVLASK